MAREIRSIAYYKEMLEVNDKWLGTQAKELLQHYVALEDKCAALSYAAYNNAEACRHLEEQMEAVMGYAFVLESMLRSAGIEHPVRPSALDAAQEEDE